ILLSPAKTLDFKRPAPTTSATKPAMLERSEVLVDTLRDFSARRLSSLMNISPQLGALNRERFGNWHTPFTKDNAKQALFAFKGDVYVGLDAESLSEEDLKYAQKHVRILSGLYGALRPLDLIQPYRLEMGTKLKNVRGKDLYQFWGDDIVEALNRQLKSLKSSTVVNLASVEYFKSVNTDALKAEVVSPVFLDLKNGTYKIISFYAKKARGFMSAWIVRNRIEDPKKLRKFDVAGYRYSAELSEPGKPAFVRDQKPE
ncbi:MAG: peroxide stress protein YaaA, partial [Rhodothermales bacterium]